MGRLRAYACFRGARLDDTRRFVHNILTHNRVLATPWQSCTVDDGSALFQYVATVLLGSALELSSGSVGQSHELSHALKSSRYIGLPWQKS